MRYIKELNPDTIKLLKRIYKNSKKHHIRQRAKCILMSAEGYQVRQLAKYLEVHTNSIFNWLNDWEARKMAGIYLQQNRGVKPKLALINPIQVEELVEHNPKKLNNVCAIIETKWGVSVSKKTLSRFLKKRGYTWRRFRKGLKDKRDEKDYQEKKSNYRF